MTTREKYKAKVVRRITTTRSIDLSEDEIKDLILEAVGMPGGEVEFDEYSCGGIRGCTVIETQVSTEDGEL
jgi:hypothetical protein